MAALISLPLVVPYVICEAKCAHAFLCALAYDFIMPYSIVGAISFLQLFSLHAFQFSYAHEAML